MTRSELRNVLRNVCNVTEEYTTITCGVETACIRLCKEREADVVKSKLTKRKFTPIKQPNDKPNLCKSYIEFMIPKRFQKKPPKTYASALFDLENSIKPNLKQDNMY